MGAGDSAAGILRTKLYAPRLPDIIPREKLLRELDAAKTSKLTTIVAGAGYGKSTLAAAFLTAYKAPSVWYQLEETDCDLSEFITYLVAGIGMQENGFGEETLDRLQAAKDVAGESRIILSTFISEFDSCIKGDFFIVLDDFQEVNDSPQITEAIDFLLGHMPPHLHLVILSRSKLNLDLSGLAAHRELMEIKETGLSFSPRETSELFADIFGLPLRDEDAQALYQHTEGWITGMVLFWLAVRDKGKGYLRDALQDLKVPPTRIAEFLSGMVFESQSETVREFSMKTSLLSRMNPEFCDQLLGMDESGLILDHLANSRLFTLPLDDRGDWYRYHHLLRSFLRERLSESCSHEEINQLNLKAATLWESFEEPEQALAHYLEAGEHDKATGILESIAPGLMKASRISFLYDNLSRLPEDSLEKHPWLLFHLAEIFYIQGDYDRALRDFERAALLFEESGDVGAQARSLQRLGSAQYQLARFEEYEGTAAKLRDITPVGSPQWYELAAIWSSTAFFEGSYDLAERFLTEALEHAHEVEDETSRATLLYFCGLTCFARGDFERSCEVMYQASELAERLDLTAILMQAYGVLGVSLTMRDRCKESLECAEKGLTLVDKLGHDTSMAFLYRASKANALALMGDIGAARRETETASSLSEKYGAGMEVLLAEYIMGHQYMMYGDSTHALRHYSIAHRMARELAYPESIRVTRLGEIWASHGEVGIEAAIEEAKTIARQLKESSSDAIIVYAYLILAFLELTAGHTDEARQTLQAAVELTERDCVLGWNRILWADKAASGLLLPLIAEIFSRCKHLEVLGKVFAYIGSSSIPYLNKLAKSKKPRVRKKASELVVSIAREAAAPLAIRMLGTFELNRGGVMISAGDWRSKKALAVMKYLAAQDEKRLVPRDVLMELLWPESTPESASKNLGMALTSLRKILEPETARGESSYLVTSGDSLHLELGSGGWIDFKLFRLKIEEAEDAKGSGDHGLYLKRLKEAEELYRGDFLAEDLYEDWCRPERDRLHGEYLNLLLNISDEYMRRGDPGKALHYMEKAIEADPGREDLYRGQMEIYFSVGDRAGVERAFQRCSDYLKDNFDVEPSSETVELYHKLRS